MSDEVMADIQRSLGRIEQKIDSHVQAFDAHIAMDMKAYEAISTLSKSQARQKGFISGIVALAGALGSAAGLLVHKLLSP